jgi:hypothetical protein
MSIQNHSESLENSIEHLQTNIIIASFLFSDITSSHYRGKRSFFTQTQYSLNTMQYLANVYNQSVLMPIG